MPFITLPHASTGLRDGVDRNKGSVVLANDQAIAAVVNGGLKYDNLAADADIRASQLTVTSGLRIVEANLETGSADSRVLKADSALGSPLAGVGSKDHVKDDILTGLKMKRTGGGTIGSDALMTGVYQTSCGALYGPSLSGGAEAISSGIATINGYTRAQIVPLHVWLVGVSGALTTVLAYYMGNASDTKHYFAITNLGLAAAPTADYTLNFAYIVIAST